jgi:hypothetical protein
MPALLVDAAERIIVPVTALCGIDPDPLRRLLRPGVRRASPRGDPARLGAGRAGPDTAEGIARSVIDFALQFLTEDHGN